MISVGVYLWDNLIGAVSQENLTSIPLFQYNEDFLSSGIQVSPIVMPLSKEIYSFPLLMNTSFNGLPGLVYDSLPDKFGNKLIQEYLDNNGRMSSELAAVEKLCFAGQRGMGALEYKPDIANLHSKNEPIVLDDLVQVASDILSNRKSIHASDEKNLLEQLINVGTSAGGARAKAVIAWNKKTHDIRSGQIDAGDGYEYWLIKFDGVDNNKDKEKVDGKVYTRIEYAYYLMAQSAGIIMNPCKLYKDGDKYHFMTKRFDRTDKGEKIHMQTLSALTHLDYNEPGICSYEQVSNVMRKMKISQNEIEQFYLRMLFNIMANNRDDHTKNISFLMQKSGQWNLSPAYDITYAYNPAGSWTKWHQMTINNKKDNFVKSDFYEAGAKMDISKPKVNNMILRVEDSLSKWSEFAEQSFIPKGAVANIKKNFQVL